MIHRFSECSTPQNTMFPAIHHLLNPDSPSGVSRCPSDGKGLYKILRRWYKRIQEEPCQWGPRSRIPRRNGNGSLEKSGSQVIWGKGCLPSSATPNCFLCHQLGRVFFTLALNPASSGTCKAAPQPSRDSRVSSVPDTQRAHPPCSSLSFGTTSKGKAFLP